MRRRRYPTSGLVAASVPDIYKKVPRVRNGLYGTATTRPNGGDCARWQEWSCDSNSKLRNGCHGAASHHAIFQAVAETARPAQIRDRGTVGGPRSMHGVQVAVGATWGRAQRNRR